MADLAFDTLNYARRMEQVGFTQQAEAMAEEQARLIDDRLATKTDIERIRGEIEVLRKDMAFGNEALRKEIETLRKDTTLGAETLRRETTLGIETLRKEMTQQIEALRQETKLQFELVRRDIEVLRRDLTVRLGGIIVAAAAAASTIVTLFGRLAVPHS